MGYFDSMMDAIKNGDLVLVEETHTCSECKGSGKVPQYYWYKIVGEKICSTCGGQGTVTGKIYRPK